MSVIGSQRTTFGDETGADGRVITDTDLNEISRNMTRRAWEFPGYAGLIGFDQVGSSYTGAFEGLLIYSRIRGVYTYGEGLKPTFSGLGSSIGAGFLGCYMDGDTPTRPAAYGACKMHWVAAADGDIAYTHDAAASGKTRWDLITVALSEVNASTVPRHFKDAVTGQVSSQAVIPARQTTMAATLTKGEESSGTPTMPSVPSGGHVLYAVKVSDSAIVDLWDFTLPVGNLRESIVLARTGITFRDEWVVEAAADGAFGMISSLPHQGDLFVLPPPELMGSRSTLILGASVHHSLASTCTVSLCRLAMQESDQGHIDIIDISSSFQMDSTLRRTTLDFCGYPGINKDKPPIWACGMPRKGETNSTIALRFNSDAQGHSATSIVRSVKWLTL